jgi:hypothetical protein
MTIGLILYLHERHRLAIVSMLPDKADTVVLFGKLHDCGLYTLRLLEEGGEALCIILANILHDDGTYPYHKALILHELNSGVNVPPAV